MQFSYDAFAIASLGLVIGLAAGIATPSHAQDTAAWKAGVARVDITPDNSVWLAGYASRDHGAERTLMPLNAKALAIEDADGNRAVLVTTDILGYTKDLSDRVRDRLEAECQLPRARVILSASHTHSGPLLPANLNGTYPIDEAGTAAVEAYEPILEERLIQVVKDALADLGPAGMESGNGVVRFAVNRRNNKEAEVPQLHAFNGPSDHAVPVLKVARPDGQVLAIVFGYACHATVLSINEWSGDYPGFAQAELEKLYPGATAMFFAGCAGDQNPLPRRTIPLAQQYGRELAAAVNRVLEDGGKELAPTLVAEYEEIELAINPVPTREELAERAANSSGYEQRVLQHFVKQIDAGVPLRQTYPYPVQVWRLGEQALVAIGGEVVVEYAIAIKQALGYDTFVMAYANDVPGYIPSSRVLAEGGYEGASSQMLYNLSNTWADDVEERVLNGVRDVATRAGLAWTEKTAAAE